MVSISESEIGKEVVTDEGQRIGEVTDVDEETLYIDLTAVGDESQPDMSHGRQSSVNADEIEELTEDQVIVYEPEQH